MASEIQGSTLQKISSEVTNCILKEYRTVIMSILEQDDIAATYAVVMSFESLNFSCPITFDNLLSHPDVVFKQADLAATHALHQVYEEERDHHPNLTFKGNLRVRLRADSFNRSCPVYKHTFPDCSESGQYMVLVGTVTSVKVLRTLQFQKPYRCSKCNRIKKYESPPSRFHRFPAEINLECESGCGKPTFKLVSGKALEELTLNQDLRDYQEIKIQENFMGYNYVVNGNVCTVVLEDDLTNSCSPGDNVLIGGWLFNRFKAFQVGKKIEGQCVFKANHVAVENLDMKECFPTVNQIEEFRNFWKKIENNPFLGRDQILKSFCSSICGMFPAKLALLTAIIGGVDNQNKDQKKRSKCHVLLVGDPAIGKSQLLSYCSKLIPRSVFISGAGVSAAGLTVGAVKVDKEWELQGGALVLAGSGICCIDEFTVMHERERSSILEAMEQQTISVAKAGIISNLKVDCSVFAAANPKTIRKTADGKYDVEIGIESPLLSRFDVTMLMIDEKNSEWDEKFADFILGLSPNTPNECPTWGTEKLKMYIAYVKKFEVEISDDASKVLTEYYIHQRRTQKSRSLIVTPRFIESLKRLTEGHARIMYRKHALVMDAIVSLLIMEYSYYSTNILEINSNSVSQVSFPDDALDYYRNTAKQLLGTLGLNSIWLKEEQWLSKITSEGTQQRLEVDNRVNASTSVIATQPSNNRMEDDSQRLYDWFCGDSSGHIYGGSASSIDIVPASFPVGSSDLSEIGAASQDDNKKQ